MVFACMEAEESSALPRITTGRLDMSGRYMARFVLVNRMPTLVYDRERCCRHDSAENYVHGDTSGQLPSGDMIYAIPSFIGPNTRGDTLSIGDIKYPNPCPSFVPLKRNAGIRCP